MKISILLALHKENLNVSTCIPSLQGNSSTGVSQLGINLSAEDVVRDLTVARLPLLFHSDRPRHRSSINDNYCAHFVVGNLFPVCVTGKVNFLVTGVERDLNSVPVTRKYCHSVTGNLITRTHVPVYCHDASHVHFAGGSSQKKSVNLDHQQAWGNGNA